MKHQMQGATFVEIIAFIVVLAIVAAILLSFNTVFNYLGFLNTGTTGLELAQQRMELIIRNPQIRIPAPQGNLSNLTDICAVASPPAACNYSAVPGYNVNATISNDCSGETNFVSVSGTAVFSPITDCKEVVVTVTKTGSVVSSKLTMAVANVSY